MHKELCCHRARNVLEEESLACAAAWALCGHDAPPGTAACQELGAESGQSNLQGSDDPPTVNGAIQGECKASRMGSFIADASRKEDSESARPSLNRLESSATSSRVASGPEDRTCGSESHAQQLPPSQLSCSDFCRSNSGSEYPQEPADSPAKEDVLPLPARTASKGEPLHLNTAFGTPSGQSPAEVKHASHVAVGIPMMRRAAIGMQCKRLLDHARLQFLLAAGFQVRPSKDAKSNMSSCGMF